MKLIFVRHGETQENAEGIMQGWNSGTITKKGAEQINSIAQRLNKEKIDKIFASPLSRTKKTAEEIVKFHPEAEIIYDDRLKDIHRGIFTGKPKIEFMDELKKSGKSISDFTPENGESKIQVEKRIKEFINDVFIKEKNKTILIVSHSIIITKATLYLLKVSDKEYSKYQPKNTAITIINIREDGNHKAELIADDSHLKP